MQSEDRIEYVKDGSPEKSLSRRDFVRVLSAAAAIGPGLIGSALGGISLTGSQRAEAAEAMAAGLGKLPKRRLGTRLGHMEVTPICISSDWNSALYGPGLALGINFVHKAGYWKSLPEEFQRLPRESYYTDITVDSTPNNPDDEDGAYNQVTSSLEKNGLKYYDIFRAHFGWRTVDAMRTKRGTYKAFQRLKREGKVRYFGVSQHPYVPYPEIIEAEIQDGLIDSMQVWFSYASDDATREIFAKAHKAGIGMTAMKVYQNGHQKMQADPSKMQELKAGGHVGRACIREVMTARTNGTHGAPIFHTCVSSLGSMETFEDNIGGLSPKIAADDGFPLWS